ncbi:TRAP transporter small permease subunit [Enterovirga aerilata]|uniref:TRAP transporter small permease protein n=1 Tax=Enterovirga aerilata TaxID=2730920 RepID=A0A849I487_9HYPH|nr:TRAP transporter small permease subunit [Enterovirga sp. DB1703]NNM70950.1 TRAP transporter small permease subunit [Enterovirga sp. DB1703]
MPERLERWARGLDAIVEASGRIASWSGLALVLVMAANVIIRYVFRTGSVAMQELEWHLMAPLSLLCIAYAIKHEGHVQVDILYGRLPRRVQEAIGLFSALAAVALCLLLVWLSLPYVMQSYRVGEGSPDPGGLPHRWILKALIPAAFVLLGLQSVASVLRALGPFLGGPHRDVPATVTINAP